MSAAETKSQTATNQSTDAKPSPGRPVPALCNHIKTDGVRCGSPAVKGTDLCFHHSAVKTALGKMGSAKPSEDGSFAPIPFVFPEDRAAMQLNYFLLLTALNEQRITPRTANLMIRMLRAMDKNLGVAGSLIEASEEAVIDVTASGEAASGHAPMSQNRDMRHQHPHPGVSARRVELPMFTAGVVNEETFSEFISELSAAAPIYAGLPEVSTLRLPGNREVSFR